VGRGVLGGGIEIRMLRLSSNGIAEVLRLRMGYMVRELGLHERRAVLITIRQEYYLRMYRAE
jgi:hypothetical protein